MTNAVLSERLTYIDAKIKGRNSIFDNISNTDYLKDLKEKVEFLQNKMVESEVLLTNNISKEMQSVRDIIIDTPINSKIKQNVLENSKEFITHMYLTNETIEEVFTHKLFLGCDNTYFNSIPLFACIDIDFKNCIVSYSSFASLVNFTKNIIGLELSLLNSFPNKVRANKLELKVYDSEKFRFLLGKNIITSIETDRQNIQQREKTMDILHFINNMDKEFLDESLQFYNTEMQKIMDILIGQLNRKYQRKFVLQISNDEIQ